jgi:hypothetical protein
MLGLTSLGLVLSTKILRSEKFLEKVKKFKTFHFCQRGQKNYLADVLALLLYYMLRKVLKNCSI